MTTPFSIEDSQRIQAILKSNLWNIHHLTPPTIQHPFAFFNDGKRRVHFILVFSNQDAILETKKIINEYMSILKEYGLELEADSSEEYKNLTFIKVHGPRNVLLNFANTFDLELEFQTFTYRPKPKLLYHFMGNELTLINKNSVLHRRALNSSPEWKPTNITSAETIQVIYKMLQYGNKSQFRNYGIDKLLEKNICIAAYPIHDGSVEWPDIGPVTDRQLLRKFWGNIGSWYKQQPLNLIERYFGPEVAFYFAWLGFYNKMLVFPAIAGLILFTLGLFASFASYKSYEVCTSELILCPLCHPKYCNFVYHKSFCINSRIAFCFDNIATTIFAIIMLFWASMFMKLWKREEAILQIRWNVSSVEIDTTPRPEFEERTKFRKVSQFSNEPVPYVPTKIIIFKYTITLVSILFMVSLVLAVIMGLIVYRLSLSLLMTKKNRQGIIIQNSSILISTSSAIIMTIFILIFGKIYKKISLWLTMAENHRTQTEFDNSFTYKCYALAFVNNYSILFYIAFFKGKFYTYPGDKHVWSSSHPSLRTDLCNPSGCIMDLNFQLFIIMVVKTCFSSFIAAMIPFVKKHIKERVMGDRNTLKQWECEYLLKPADRYFLIAEYIDLVIQYGFVTFFVAAFPLAPLLALLNNIVELRIDAHKFVNLFRRPVPKVVSGLGVWNEILQTVTYIAVITNAFVISFTSHDVPTQIYRLTTDKYLRGYVNSTLSVFNISDFEHLSGYYIGSPEISKIDKCYYVGQRYPPDHPKRYQLTEKYWQELVIRLFVVILLEHIILILTGILTRAIPNIPFSVKEQLNYERSQFKEAKMKALNKAYMKKMGKTRLTA